MVYTWRAAQRDGRPPQLQEPPGHCHLETRIRLRPGRRGLALDTSETWPSGGQAELEPVPAPWQGSFRVGFCCPTSRSLSGFGLATPPCSLGHSGSTVSVCSPRPGRACPERPALLWAPGRPCDWSPWWTSGLLPWLLLLV